MDSINSVLEWASDSLLAAGFAVITLTRRELRAAKLAFQAAAFCIGMRWILWSFSSGQPWPVRFAVGAIVGGVILAGLPALLKLTEERALAEQPSSQIKVAQLLTQPSSLESVPAPLEPASQPNPEPNCNNSNAQIKLDGVTIINNSGSVINSDGSTSLCISQLSVGNNDGTVVGPHPPIAPSVKSLPIPAPPIPSEKTRPQTPPAPASQ